jgi:sugar phosphate isomerase/epimerase
VIILHPPFAAADEAGRAARESWMRSVDELAADSAKSGVRIALENGNRRGMEETEMAFARHGPEYLGLCYDSGHANLHGSDLLEKYPDRLISVHLHDNDGSGDQHRIPFTGTVDWERLTGLIAGSSYRKPVSLDTSTRNSPITDEGEFLAANFEAAERLARMVAAAR